MPETVTFNTELGIIECHSFGDVLLADIDNSIIEIKQMQEKNNVNKVLVDVREQASMPEKSGTFQIATSIPRSLRVAMLLIEDQPTEADMRFVEKTALSGGASIRIFFSKDDAIEWLNQ